MGQIHTKLSKLEFAARLVAWRRRRGRERKLSRPISQAEAAEELQISKRTLQNWEIARSRPGGIALQAVNKLIK